MATNLNGPSSDAFGVVLTDPIMLRHANRLILLAREAKADCNQLYFVVFDERAAVDAPDLEAWNGWYRYDFDLGTTGTVAGNVRYEEQRAAPELRLAGMDLITLPATSEPVAAGDFPFRVSSDGQSIMVYRVSKRRSLFLNRLTLIETRVEDRDKSLVRFALQNSWETRFQYSGIRDVPASDQDTLSYENATGQPFLEPTLEIPGIDPGPDGLFDVAEVPTANVDLKALFIAVNDGTAFRLHRILRDADGFLDFSDETGALNAIIPILEPGGTLLPPLAGLAPALAYYGEQDFSGGTEENAVELQRIGRMALAMPVSGSGLPRAMAFFDYAIDVNGMIIDLAGADQAAPLVDGSLSNGTFVPDNSSPAFPTPANIVAATDLRVTRMVLGQITPLVSPLLFMGDDGLLHLYYGGPAPALVPDIWSSLDPHQPEAMVAQYDTRVTRLVLTLPWTLAQRSEEPPGNVHFNALSAGSLMSGATVAITATKFNMAPQADLRDIAISYPKEQGLAAETWVGVPSDVTQFAAVLNGEATSDPADPDAKHGLRTFFDYGGTQPLARIPVVSASGDARAMQFVSALPDADLQSVKVSTAGEACVLNFAFKTSGGHPIVLGFGNLPTTLAAYGDIFEGVASSATYGYPTDPSATMLWSLATDGLQSNAPVLFCAASADVPPGLTLSVAHGLAAGTVTLEIAGAPGGSVAISDIPADVAGFVAALTSNSGFEALNLEILAAAAAGEVQPTASPQGPLSLSESTVLFELLLPAVSLALFVPTPGNYPAGLQSHSYAADVPGLPATRMAGFELGYDTPSAGIVANVEIGTATPSANRSVHGAGVPDLHAALWVRQPPNLVCSFDGSNAVVIPVQSGGTSLPKAISLRPQPRWTLEAWFKPVGSNQQQLVAYRDGSAVLKSGAPRMEYALGVKGQEVVTFASYTGFGGDDSSYFHSGISPTASFAPDLEFTWECWIQPIAAPAPPAGVGVPPLGLVFQYGDSPSNPRFACGLAADRTVHVQTLDGMNQLKDYATTASVPAIDDDGDPLWSHLALVGRKDKASGNWSIDVVLDGEKMQRFEGVPIIVTKPPALSIGGFSLNNTSMFGQVAQLRLWNFARSFSEIRRTAMITLTGREFGLLGSWPMGILESVAGGGQFVRNEAIASGPLWDAKLFVKTKQPVTMTQDSFFLSVLATIGGRPAIEAPALLRNGSWNHVALAYAAGGALDMNPPSRFSLGIYDWMQIEEPQSLDIGQRFAIDAWVVVPADNNLPGTLMARWDHDDAPEDCGFRLTVERGGTLTFEVAYIADTNGTVTVAKFTANMLVISDGKPHHIAAVFASTPQQDQNGTKIDATYTQTVYVDGMPQVASTVAVPGMSTVQVNNPDRPVLVGRSFLPPAAGLPVADESILFYRGMLGDLRFWNIAPTPQVLFPERNPRLTRIGVPKGLVAQWNFIEGQGAIAADGIGDSDGTLSTSAMWSQLEATSTIQVISNGAVIGATKHYTGNFNAGSVDQLAFGSPSGGVTGIDGQIDRIALYDRVRDPDTVQAQKYVPCAGSERTLVACWDFSADGRDITGGGNDPVPPIAANRLSASDAPISNEGPYVRNVYGGRITSASMSVPGRMAVGNYVDATSPGTDAQAAVLKRQFVMEPGQSFASAVQVGELDLKFIGQVQTDPTLIGYIEGAPPVPSENLTRPFYRSPTTTQYANASSVTLQQDSGSELSFTSQSSVANQVDVSWALGILQADKKSVTVFPFVQWMMTIENKLMAQFKVSTETGQSHSGVSAGSWGLREGLTMALSGDWETAPYLNAIVGRRYVAANLGLALVESLTANLYAMVFRSTGTSLGTIILPDPEIPPDRNLILFPMKAKYTKASTLDGKVGLVNDPDFLDADMRRGSYFKPSEAYATQQRIEFQQQRARAFAASFDAQGRGKSKNSELPGVAAKLPAKASDDEEKLTDPPGALIPTQGIVNKFVWTSDGGTNSEQRNYGARVSKTFSGFNRLAGGLGVKGEGKFLVKAGFAWSLDVLYTHTTRVDVGNTMSASSNLTLNVAVSGESMLKGWNETTQAFSPQQAPGKVRAYRFSTFYLPPSVKNGTDFANIVDPVWRRMSNDTMARAMREMNVPNPVFRVFHRTTYVERVPPPAAAGPSFAPRALCNAPVNIEGNIGLCRLVDAALSGIGANTDQLNVADAVAAVINPAPTRPGVYPTSVLETRVPWWGDFLASARPDQDGKVASAANAAVLQGIQARCVRYMYAGYVTGTIPQAIKAYGKN